MKCIGDGAEAEADNLYREIACTLKLVIVKLGLGEYSFTPLDPLKSVGN